MKSFKFQPVLWMTTIVTVLTALMTLDETVDILPEKVSPYVLGAIAVLTAILGKLAHDRATATADPKTTIDGTIVPLVPKPSAIPADATSSVPDPQRT